MTTQQTVELPIVAKLHGIADFLPTSPAEDVRQAADVIKEAVESLTAMVARAPERDTKWAGMTARDIALVTLTKLTGEKQ
jgi:hypothetical protein